MRWIRWFPHGAFSVANLPSLCQEKNVQTANTSVHRQSIYYNREVLTRGSIIFFVFLAVTPGLEWKFLKIQLQYK